MKNQTKLFGGVAFIAIATVATAMAGCNGNSLPTTTVPSPGTPGFSVKVTNNGNPASGIKLFLKSFNGGTEGNFTNSSHVSGSTVSTGSDGTVFVPVPANATSGLYGIGYDATSADSGNQPNMVSEANNTSQIQYFTTPAVNLATKPNNQASVSFDLSWNGAAFQPANNATASLSNGVTFVLAPYSGAMSYEVDINSGSVAGSGSNVDKLTSTTTSLPWTNATSGTFVWQAKANTPSGIAGVSNNLAGSPWLSLTVQ